MHMCHFLLLIVQCHHARCKVMKYKQMKYEIALDRQWIKIFSNDQRDKTCLGYSTGLLKKLENSMYFTLSRYYFVL